MAGHCQPMTTATPSGHHPLPPDTIPTRHTVARLPAHAGRIPTPWPPSGHDCRTLAGMADATPCRTLHRPPHPYRIGHHRHTLAGSRTAWHTATVATGRDDRRTLPAWAMLHTAGHRHTLAAVASWPPSPTAASMAATVSRRIRWQRIYWQHVAAGCCQNPRESPPIKKVRATT